MNKNAVKKIIILGTGGNSIDILDTLDDINSFSGAPRYRCEGFLDDDKTKWGEEIFGKKVLGPLESAREYKDAFFINGIGNPFNFWRKEEIIGRAGSSPERFETIVHPTASISRAARLGKGVVIFQNVTITTNVTIGNHVIILPNTVISHDDSIGDYTCITSGICISAGIKVGKACYLGANSALLGNITIGDYCLVGMGSVVLDNVESNSVVVGNPARFLRHTVPEKVKR